MRTLLIRAEHTLRLRSTGPTLPPDAAGSRGRSALPPAGAALRGEPPLRARIRASTPSKSGGGPRRTLAAQAASWCTVLPLGGAALRAPSCASVVRLAG